jgi:hypothetical protein
LVRKRSWVQFPSRALANYSRAHQPEIDSIHRKEPVPEGWTLHLILVSSEIRKRIYPEAGGNGIESNNRQTYNILRKPKANG